MNGQTSGAIMENYDAALLAGFNVMHYSDSIRRDVPVGVPLDLSTPCNGVARVTEV